MTSGILPEIWKKFVITPIYKKRDRPMCAYNKSVTFTCVACKIMGLMIRDRIMEHLLKHGLISKCQYGF